VLARVISNSRDPTYLFSNELPFVTGPLIQSAQSLSFSLNSQLRPEDVGDILISAYAHTRVKFDPPTRSTVLTSKLLFLLVPILDVCSGAYILNICSRHPKVVLVLHPEHTSTAVSHVVHAVIVGLKFFSIEAELDIVDMNCFTTIELLDKKSPQYETHVRSLFDDSNATASKLLYMQSVVARGTPQRVNIDWVLGNFLKMYLENLLPYEAFAGVVDSRWESAGLGKFPVATASPPTTNPKSGTTS
jgi:hypothetical protein